MPYNLSEEQIEFILNDIHARGIEIEKLQINLLDHICCLIEENMNEGDDFEAIYLSTIKQFYENKLNELEKETKGLLKFKYYYSLKNILYIIFVASISYNIYGGTKMAVSYFNTKKYFEESRTLKGVTLKDGYNYLIQRLKIEYPNMDTKDFICVSFLSHPLGEWEKDIFQLDTLFFRELQQGRTKQLYKNIDSLAGIYNKHITYVIAFQRTDDATDEVILENKSQTKNLIYVNGMTKLRSGYNNQKNTSGESFPTIFILDKNGKLVYDDKSYSRELSSLSRFLKTLPN